MNGNEAAVARPSASRLLDAWEQAFLAERDWSTALRSGLLALEQELAADEAAALRGALLRVDGASRDDDEREATRSRLVEVLAEQWTRVTGGPPPGIYLEIFAGELLLLLHRRAERTIDGASLIDGALALWGPSAPSATAASCARPVAAGALL